MLSPAARSGRKLLTVAVAVVVLLSLATGPVVGQSTEGATGTIVVGPDETVDSVEGIAGTIVVRGTVTGDVSGVAGTVHVTESGTVDGDLSASAGSIRIDGQVGGDVQAGAGTIELSDGATIGGSFDAGAGYISIDGSVGESVTAGAGTISLGPNADIGGDFRYDAETFERDPGATVGGQIVQDDSLTSGFEGVPAWVGSLYGLIANLLLGLVLVGLFPAFSTRVAETVIESPAKSGGLGLVLLVLTPILLVLIAITIIGIPLSLAGLVVFSIAVWVAVVYGQFALGRWVLGLADITNRWVALLVGVIGVSLLGLVPILGGIVDLLVLLLGVGALAFALRNSYRNRRRTETGPTGGEAAPS